MGYAKRASVRSTIVTLLKDEQRRLPRSGIVAHINRRRAASGRDLVQPHYVSSVLQDLAEEGYAHYKCDRGTWAWLFAGGHPDGEPIVEGE